MRTSAMNTGTAWWSNGGVYTTLRAHLFILYHVYRGQSAHFSATLCFLLRALVGLFCPNHFVQLLQHFPTNTTTLSPSVFHNVRRPRPSFSGGTCVFSESLQLITLTTKWCASAFSTCAHVYTLSHTSPSQSSSSSTPCNNMRCCRFPSTHRCAVQPALIQMKSNGPAHTGRCRLRPHESSSSETKCWRRFFWRWALSPLRFGSFRKFVARSTMMLHGRCIPRHEYSTRQVRDISTYNRCGIAFILDVRTWYIILYRGFNAYV